MSFEGYGSQHLAVNQKSDLAGGSRSDFAARLAGKFLDGDKNVVFSPASIYVVVGLIAAGASGATLNQALAFLKLKSKEELVSMYQNITGTTYADDESSFSDPRLSFVNGVWLDQSLKFQQPFKKIACGAFKALTQEVDFQSKPEQVRQEVNSWVKKKTHGLIKDILPYGIVTEISRLILANSIYFKASWANKFKAQLTVYDDFHTLDGKTFRIPFMKTGQRQYISEFDGFKVLQLFYQQDYTMRRLISMIIFLPDAKDGLKSLIERMGSELGFLDKYIPVKIVNVGKFMLPKFEMSYELELSRDLKDMGLNLPFDQLGGFREMVTNPEEGKWLVVSKIFHKSFISVDEEGTTAAAATLAFKDRGCSRNPVPEKSFDFVADHPFAFVIKERNSNDVLFAGSVVNPL